MAGRSWGRDNGFAKTHAHGGDAGATVMDSVFGDPDHDLDNGSGHGMNAETA
jgi:hypothetical protein